MSFLVNIRVDDPRFEQRELAWAIENAKKFYEAFGANLVFIWRRGLVEHSEGCDLHFSQPNGSHATGTQAKVTLSDWYRENHRKPQIVIHELGDSIFKLPDHYVGAPNPEPTSEPCIMNSLNQYTFCSKCRESIRNTINVRLGVDVLLGLSIVALVTAPLWFPILRRFFR